MMLQKNLELGRPLKLSYWRKIALGTWRTVGDPSVYGFMDLNVDPALEYIEKARAKYGVRITMTHFFGHVMAQVYKRHPMINCILRLGRLYPRKHVDVFFQVAGDKEGKDLTGTVVRQAESKTLLDFAKELEGAVHSIKNNGDDKAFKVIKKRMKNIPGLCMPWLLDFLGTILYTFNLWHPALGTPKDPFGSMMITNIGSIGLDMALAPIVPYSRVPVLLVMGEVRKAPYVITHPDGRDEVKIGNFLRIGVTVDHRVVDGMYASHMYRSLNAIMADPIKELGEL